MPRAPMHLSLCTDFTMYVIFVSNGHEIVAECVLTLKTAQET